MPAPLLADYEEPRAAFRALLEPACDNRILLFSGASGCGKTTLVAACLEDARAAGCPTLAFDLRGSANSVPEIFSRLGTRLGWEHLPALAQQTARLQQAPTVQIDRTWMFGMGNHIHVALQAQDPADREERRAALTAALFTDLRARAGRLLIAIDTYERAIPDVQDWLGGPFLGRLADAPHLRVLIAGQTVPDARHIEWGHCCDHYPLHGVPDAIHWLPIVKAMNRYIDAPDPLSWLAGICHYVNGAPKEIMQVIEALPRLEATA